jgi:hypothetical protein
MARGHTRRDWSMIDPLIDNLKAQGWNDTQIAKDLGIGRQTLVDHLRVREGKGIPTAHPGTPEHSGVPQEHLAFPTSPHLSTPEEHQEVSPTDSGVLSEHSGVPTRQGYSISTSMVHPGTPTAEDWELWNTIKARWLEVEKMLVNRQVLPSTPQGTPGRTQKKTALPEFP